MSERFRVVTLSENPKRRGHARIRRQLTISEKLSRRKPRQSPRRRKPARVHRVPACRYLVEALKQKGVSIAFLYWTGTKFVTSRAQARRYPTKKLAYTAAQVSMQGRPTTFRLARVIPA